MVDERITDGKRIGQLLASELTGLERGPLAVVSVVDADTDVEPTEDGAFAYRIVADDTPVGTVAVTPATARLTLESAPESVPDRADVTVDGNTLIAHNGAAVKGLVDTVIETLSE